MDLKKRLLLFSYRLVGPISLTHFGDLKKNMAKAGMRTSFRAYVGLLTLTSIMVGVGTFAAVVFFSLFFSILMLQAVTLATGLGILGAVLSVCVYYSYPVIKASTRGTQIDANLPLIANYMSVLASAGVTPERIFRSLARSGGDLKVDREARMVVRNTELLGLDLFTALHDAAEKSPSKDFASLLEGIIASSHSGGDLATYLRDLSSKYLRERGIKLSRFLDNLGVAAEIHVAFMVAAPLLLIVMLSVLSFLGGGIGGLSPEFLLYFMTYIVLPLGVFFILVVLDAMIPAG